ncbi:S-formylglutathione hydrolase [Pseudovibrio japonicus]|uniref:S-formylglutathione hydrolase n=1 Tax=Pseudovibrio japonicus TaxID=366534 RepID=A0ABQ3ELB4_9HYPH|nr:S-formylglutathione hydrolase [Pseudovibrio japonicus]GHB42491.1 S-formylglutathione hydrolase [Pseudovibrio japonicus]
MIELIKSWRCFDGEQRVYRYDSKATGTPMEFAVFLPRRALNGEECPTLMFLSGLTCTWENMVSKAGSQRAAAELGMIIVAPDTSPRGEEVADDDGWDMGKSAGFYLNATQEPWAKHYRMEEYITQELPEILEEYFPVDLSVLGLTGHSMGGHGALTLAIKNPGLFKSVSAFAPIVNPMNCPWGEKAFSGYLGADRSSWAQYDACELIRARGWKGRILIDQGSADDFLEEQLKPWVFEKACREEGVDLTLRMHGGYDHSYYCIASFMPDHIAWHYDELV